MGFFFEGHKSTLHRLALFIGRDAHHNEANILGNI